MFEVIRRCQACGMVCEPGCNCDRVTVTVQVDELTDEELAGFLAEGTPAQRAEIAEYLADLVAA